MEDMRKLNSLLAETGVRYNIPGLRLSAQGAVGLRLKNGAELYLEHDQARRMLYAYTFLFPLPKDEGERMRLFARMLECNFLCGEAGDGTLSIRDNAAVLHIGFSIAGLDSARFESGLRQLIAVREEFSRKLLAPEPDITPRRQQAGHAARAMMSVLRRAEAS